MFLLLSCFNLVKKYDYRGYEIRAERLLYSYYFSIYYENVQIIPETGVYEANEFFSNYDKLLSEEFSIVDKLVEVGIK